MTDGGISISSHLEVNASLKETNIKQVNASSYSISSYTDYILDVMTSSTLYLPELELGRVFWVYSGNPIHLPQLNFTMSSTYSTFISTGGASFSNHSFSNEKTLIIRAVNNNFWTINAI